MSNQHDILKVAIKAVPDFPIPGVMFRDISPLLANPRLLRYALHALMSPFVGQGVTKVLGIESRGFIFGSMLAERLDAGLVLARKKGKLPGKVLSESYGLEYGEDTIEILEGAIVPGDIVLVHDDVIATGGTAAAACALAESAGGTVIGCSFLIELDFLKGREKLEDQDIYSLVHF